MKKSLSLLLALVMILSLTACGGGQQPTTAAPTSGADAPSTTAPAETTTEEPKDMAPKGTVIVGQGTELSGDWITAFTNNASDNVVLQMISGYSTFERNFGGEYVLN
ncbi:MAG: hypothetical protein Q4A52_06630, partial [Bacillota bacterium]|nr:hypothetical protein [Bacillota bacterium]